MADLIKQIKVGEITYDIGEQPDWQANISMPGHILNRTHYEDIAFTETVCENISVSGDRYSFSSANSLRLDYCYGKNLACCIDGEYSYFNNKIPVSIGSGSGSTSGSYTSFTYSLDTGELTLYTKVKNYEDGTVAYETYGSGDSSKTYNLSIYIYTSSIVQLDEKYIPSTIARISDIASSEHVHDASDITSGVLAIAQGGTGITSNPSMLVNLASTTAGSVFTTSPRPGVTGTLAVANGGTGATTAAAALVNLGANKAIKSITRSGTTFTYTCLDGTTGTFTQQDNNTTYSAGTGISLSGTTFSNSGVHSIATGTSNGTISVNTNGTSANVAVKGLGSNAYTSTAYLPLTGGTMSGQIKSSHSTGGMWINGRDSATIRNTVSTSGSSFAPITSSKTQLGSWELGPCHPQENFYFSYASDTNYKAGTNSTSTTCYITKDGTIYGAVWNDYAEYRQTVNEAKPGQVVIENGDGSLRLSTERLQPGCEVVSDTFGFAIGETDECKTPIAATGRVLVYTYEDRNSYLPGDAVCSAPDGKVSKMTREEIINYPERIIGTVSEIPSYEKWGSGNVEVNGRIWIRIR